MKRALITRVTGQDGSYLAELLREKGYAVSGVARSIDRRQSRIGDPVELIKGDVCDEALVRNLVSKKFDEIYNLASVATVQGPWEDPVGTIASTWLAPFCFLEAIRTLSPETLFFQASSAEMYGDPVESPQKETTIFRPLSPYGSGKLFAHNLTENYRSAHGVFAVSGILFNHESPRRPSHFVTRKITGTLARIARGANDVLKLGNLDAKRDWSFAGDIVRGMWLSMQHTVPGTYVFASGEVHTVREFVEEAARFFSMNLRWKGGGADEKAIDARGKVVVEIDLDFYRSLGTSVR